MNYFKKGRMKNSKKLLVFCSLIRNFARYEMEESHHRNAALSFCFRIR